MPYTFFLYYSDGSKNVRSLMFDRLKPKIGCSSSITIRWTRSSSFDVRKNDVRVSSMSDLVNVVKALLGSKFDVRSFEAKSRVFEFDHQLMNMFEFVRCSKNDVRVRSMFDPTLALNYSWIKALEGVCKGFHIVEYFWGYKKNSSWRSGWEKKVCLAFILPTKLVFTFIQPSYGLKSKVRDAAHKNTDSKRKFY